MSTTLGAILLILIVVIIIRLVTRFNVNYYSGKGFALAAHCILLSGALLFVWGVTYDPEDFGATVEDITDVFIGSVVVFGIPAVIFYAVASSVRMRMRKRYEAYYYYIVEENIQEIDQLVERMGLSSETVWNDLKYMIETGMFPPEFELNGGYEEEYATEETGTEGPRVPVAVNCPGCGAAASMTPGVKGECEFCGHPLQASVS